VKIEVTIIHRYDYPGLLPPVSLRWSNPPNRVCRQKFSEYGAETHFQPYTI